MAFMFPATGSESAITAQPVGDAFVNKSQPTKNFATATSLKVRDASPVLQSYLQFDVSGVPSGETVSNATLRLYSFGAEGDACPTTGIGVDVYEAASDNWSQATITYSNSPGKSGSLLSSADNFGTNLYVDLDVTR